MDKIIAKGLRFRGCHGVLPQEKIEKQVFIVDLVIYHDLHRAGASDQICDTISYDEVYHQVEHIVEQESYNLIEALAENIAASLLYKFPMQGIKVTVYKPNAPVDGKFDHFAVQIKRFRK